MPNPKKAIAAVNQAVETRLKITKLYKEYRKHQRVGMGSIKIGPHHFKRTVDAIYYLGGGWPHPSSKGRMEAQLDNVAELYRILSFIERGNLVEEYLAEHGITIKLAPKSRLELQIDPADRARVREILGFAIDACLELQKEICGLADHIKDELRPIVQEELEIEDAEYLRLYDLSRVANKRTDRSRKRFAGKRTTIAKSLENFGSGAAELKA